MSSRLPVELYTPIIYHLPSPDHKQDLYTLCIASKALHRAAIGELYRSVECRDRLTTKLFLHRIATVGKEEDLVVATLVHKLTLSMGSSDRQDVLSPMRGALLVLHNLRVLDIWDSNDTQGVISPVSVLSQVSERTQFKLTHLSLRLPFIYDTNFERLLSRHNTTLQFLELRKPDLDLEVDDLEVDDLEVDDLEVDELEDLGELGTFATLHYIAAPGYYLARLLAHSQPTNIRDIDSGLKYGRLSLEGLRSITSYSGNPRSSIDDFTLNTFGNQLRFLRLYVPIEQEDSWLYPPLSRLPVLRALELVWNVYRHKAPYAASGKFIPKLAVRLQGIITTCFERSVSPDFECVFSNVYARDLDPSWQKWERGAEAGVEFDEGERLWMTNW